MQVFAEFCETKLQRLKPGSTLISPTLALVIRTSFWEIRLPPAWSLSGVHRTPMVLERRDCQRCKGSKKGHGGLADIYWEPLYACVVLRDFQHILIQALRWTSVGLTCSKICLLPRIACRISTGKPALPQFRSIWFRWSYGLLPPSEMGMWSMAWYPISETSTRWTSDPGLINQTNIWDRDQVLMTSLEALDQLCLKLDIPLDISNTWLSSFPSLPKLVSICFPLLATRSPTRYKSYEVDFVIAIL